MSDATVGSPPERFGPAVEFIHLLHAEWTKFRTVRGWLGGLLAATAAILALGLLPGMAGSCDTAHPCSLPIGPGGEEVTDSFSFVHAPLAGDGSIAVRVAAWSGRLPVPAGPAQPDGQATRPGLAPWAKAGLIIKDGTRPGSAYAAIMITGSHGVRMQDDYTHDRAGQGAGPPTWLRLLRHGDAVTAEESTDGTRWTTVGTVHLTGLPSTVQAGLFVTSPQYAVQVTNGLVPSGDEGGPTQATATFDHLDRQGAWSAQAWSGEHVGRAEDLPRGGYEPTGGTFTVTGSGDIAPAVSGAAGLGTTVTQTLVGTFVGLMVVVVLGALFITTEYRRGLILTTLSVSPRRGRTLAAKALVIGAVAFVAGLFAAAVVVIFGQRVLRASGVYVHPVPLSTELRLIVGSAALLAVAAVLALALGALLRRSAVAVTTVIVAIVLPYILAVSVLPVGAAEWLLRVTPAAAFAVQQSAPRYFQVANVYTPIDGYFPLAPWAGFAVLCAWAGIALAGALFMFRRRDA